MAIRAGVGKRDLNRVDGIEEALANTSKLLRRLEGKQIKRAFLPAARILLERAKELAPYDETRERGTHLRDALFIGFGDPNKPDVLVGVNHRIAPHSHLMEYGWVRLPAGKPFMRPAVTQKRRIMADSIGREIRKLVEKPIRR